MPIDDLIPKGGFCYKVLDMAPGGLCTEGRRFGRDLREFPYHEGTKQVLCPYWRRTDHGTVRCEKLALEVYDEALPFSLAQEMAKSHFGATGLNEAVTHSSFLADEVKICGINEDEDDEHDGGTGGA